jgi:hypothetical protein
MAALTKDRNTPAQLGDIQSYPVAASTKIFAGALVVLAASGFAAGGTTATGLTAVGRCEKQADNSEGANGDKNVDARAGVFRFENSAGADEITIAEIGDNCFIVDDQTVAKTDATSTRSIAGKIVQVDAQGVWVKLGL